MNSDNSLAARLRNAVELQKDLNYSDARDELKMAASLNPADDILAEIYFQLGICHIKLNEFESAEEYIILSEGILNSLGITDSPHIKETLIYAYELAGSTQKLKDLCITILANGDFRAYACLPLIKIYLKEKNYAEADEIINKAMEYDGYDKDILNSCIVVETKMKKYREALSHSKKFYELYGEDDPIINAALGDIRNQIGPTYESVRFYEKAFSVADCYKKFHVSDCLLGVSLYEEGYSKSKYSELMKFRLDYTSGLIKNTHFDNELMFFKKLRIGYLSDEFKQHPVGFFVVPVLKQSRENHSEFICYNLVKPNIKNYIGEHIFKNAKHVIDLYDKEDDAIEKSILADKPDILMELKSVTTDNKLELYARRLAPLQISWIGFPISSGVSAIDYIIADKCVDPYPQAQELYTEKLLYLKDVFLCYEHSIPESSKDLPYHRNEYITFGCFSKYIKITDKMLRLWSRILIRVKNSKIIFKAKNYSDDYIMELFKERLLRFNFSMENIIFESDDSIDKYYKRYDDIDIILDTYPFNGATTTFDALLTGTPVITMTGETHASRVGLDLLTHVGLSDLVCYSDNEYIEKTVSLANDIPRLAYLKQNLREMTGKSKLTDAAAFRTEYEHAMRKVWIDYCIKKRREGNDIYCDPSRDIGTFRDELLNGADYIKKCILEGELADDRREILDEYTRIQNSFMNELRSCKNINAELSAMFERLSVIIKRLSKLDDKQIIKVLESNIFVLERLS